ncbi:MAG: integrase core domain-containing protein [Gemmatimonadaceae bacterium]
MTHVRTSPYYPPVERKDGTLGSDIEGHHDSAKGTWLTGRSAAGCVAAFVEYYNTERLHSSIGYITPADKLRGTENEVWEARDRKVEAARERPGQRREQMAATV